MPLADIPKVSYSAKNQYDNCPRQYRYDRVEKVRPDFPTHISAIVGRAIHETASLMYKAENFTLAFLMETWPVQFNRHLEKAGYRFKSEKTRTKYLNTGAEILTKFYNSAKERGLLIRPVKTEWRGEVIVTAKSGRQYRVAFVIDLIIQTPEGLVILDFKSGSHRLTQIELDKDDQLTIYSMGMRIVLKLLEAKVGLFYIRYGTIMWSTRTEQDFERVIESVDEDWQKIQAKEFGPTYKNCHLCPFSRRCGAEDIQARSGVDMGWLYQEPR